MMLKESLESEVFKALAHPTRVQLLSALFDSGGRATVGELAKLSGVEQSNASRQIKELRLANVITMERQGRMHYCILNVEMLLTQFTTLITYLNRIKRGESCC